MKLEDFSHSIASIQITIFKRLKTKAVTLVVDSTGEQKKQVDDLTRSSIFLHIDYGLGDTGIGTDGCVTNGPSADAILHHRCTYGVDDNCLARNLHAIILRWANQTYLD